jgi:hypothetical protein
VPLKFLSPQQTRAALTAADAAAAAAAAAAEDTAMATLTQGGGGGGAVVGTMAGSESSQRGSNSGSLVSVQSLALACLELTSHGSLHLDALRTKVLSMLLSVVFYSVPVNTCAIIYHIYI